MDLFDKCYQFTTADEVREKGIYPYFHELQSKQANEVIMEGKRRIMLGSNNYLGLTTNQNVIAAGIEAFQKYGSGCSGLRFTVRKRRSTIRITAIAENTLLCDANSRTLSTRFL